MQIISITNLGLMVIFQENILSRTKDRAYIKNLDDKQNKVTHRISLLIEQNAAVYSDSFGIECTPQEVQAKSKTNLSHATYLQYNLMI